jgi:hypothetical protein
MNTAASRCRSVRAREPHPGAGGRRRIPSQSVIGNSDGHTHSLQGVAHVDLEYCRDSRPPVPWPAFVAGIPNVRTARRMQRWAPCRPCSQRSVTRFDSEDRNCGESLPPESNRRPTDYEWSPGVRHEQARGATSARLLASRPARQVWEGTRSYRHGDWMVTDRWTGRGADLLILHQWVGASRAHQ